MWELDYKESWLPKNGCFWTVVLEKSLESPLDSKEIKPVNLKGDQSWIFTERTDAETLILWPPDIKNLLIGKDSDAGKDGRQEEKGMTEDEMAGWHHWLDGREFEQAPGAGDGQGSLACYSPWGHKESDMTEQLNWASYPYFHPQFICILLLQRSAMHSSLAYLQMLDFHLHGKKKVCKENLNETSSLIKHPPGADDCWWITGYSA